MPRFCIHRHASRHPHFDLRLEHEGVLKSWAVPKGVSASEGVKRLAVSVEDHPLDYIGFSGVIPGGLYGAGTVEVWDSGAYETEAWEGDKIVVRLNGTKISGRYALIHTKDNNWLIMKLKGG